MYIFGDLRVHRMMLCIWFLGNILWWNLMRLQARSATDEAAAAHGFGFWRPCGDISRGKRWAYYLAGEGTFTYDVCTEGGRESPHYLTMVAWSWQSEGLKSWTFCRSHLCMAPKRARGRCRHSLTRSNFDAAAHSNTLYSIIKHRRLMHVPRSQLLLLPETANICSLVKALNDVNKDSRIIKSCQLNITLQDIMECLSQFPRDIPWYYYVIIVIVLL